MSSFKCSLLEDIYLVNVMDLMVSPPIVCWNPNPPNDGILRWGLKDPTGSSALIRRDPRELGLSLLAMWEHSEGGCLRASKRP